MSLAPSPRAARSRPTRPLLGALEGERPGGHPVFQCIGAVSAERFLLRSLPRLWTDFTPVSMVCACRLDLSVIASSPCLWGAGDGIQPHSNSRRCLVSHAAIAAALTLDGDLSSGERLVAFVLAGYANGEHRAWPGDPAAAARAGLSRSAYLAAKGRLAARGLIVIEGDGRGRGNSSTALVAFAAEGPRFDGAINAALFDEVLAYSRAEGPARQLLAAMAALATEDRIIQDFTTDEIRAAAGLADSTFRRARAALLASGELVLEVSARGRGNTNRWAIARPRAGTQPVAPKRRRAVPRGARPLMGSVPAPLQANSDTRDGLAGRAKAIGGRSFDAAAASAATGSARAEKGPVPGGFSDGQDQTRDAVVSHKKGPVPGGFSDGQDQTRDAVDSHRKGPVPGLFSLGSEGSDRAVLHRKGPVAGGFSDGQDQTRDAVVSHKKGPVPGGFSSSGPTDPGDPPQNPPENPPENPPLNARAGREAWKLGSSSPPNPPTGGSTSEQITVVENVTTGSGRRRRRPVAYDVDALLAELTPPTAGDEAAWAAIRQRLEGAVGDATFAVWLEPVELLAADRDGALVLGCPEAAASWTFDRFGRVLGDAATGVGRTWRPALPAERLALALSPVLPISGDPRCPAAAGELPINQKEAS
jgi:hypothetical protein